MTASKVGAVEAVVYHSIAWTWAAVFVCAVPLTLKPYWDRIITLGGGQAQTFIIGTWLMNVLMTIWFNLTMVPIYFAESPFFERFKLSSKQWPWKSANAEDRDEFWSFTRRSLCLVVLNNLLVAVPGTLVLWEARRLLGDWDMSSSSFPDVSKTMWQLAVCLIVEDCMFYWCHRTLHAKALYPHIHKWHHAYYQPITLAAEHAHPIEFAIGNLLPVMAGPLLLQAAGALTGRPELTMHTITVWMFVLLRVYVSVEEHCGYEFPWSPVRILPYLGASPGGHDWHHSHNAGMFASQFKWWDWLCGTDLTFKAWQAKEAGEGQSVQQ